MERIFALTQSPASDHCEECGGEEFEGSCGALGLYFVIHTTDDHSDIPIVTEFRPKVLCEFCASEIVLAGEIKSHKT